MNMNSWAVAATLIFMAAIIIWMIVTERKTTKEYHEKEAERLKQAKQEIDEFVKKYELTAEKVRMQALAIVRCLGRLTTASHTASFGDDIVMVLYDTRSGTVRIYGGSTYHKEQQLLSLEGRSSAEPAFWNHSESDEKWYQRIELLYSKVAELDASYQEIERRGYEIKEKALAILNSPLCGKTIEDDNLGYFCQTYTDDEFTIEKQSDASLRIYAPKAKTEAYFSEFSYSWPVQFKIAPDEPDDSAEGSWMKHLDEVHQKAADLNAMSSDELAAYRAEMAVARAMETFDQVTKPRDKVRMPKQVDRS